MHLKEKVKMSKDKDMKFGPDEKNEPRGREKPEGNKSAIPGINTPGIELPAFNPPVPNRAWTAMRNGVDIDVLTPEEKRDLYVGRDDII